LFEHHLPGVVIANDTEERDIQPQLPQTDALVRTLAAEQLTPFGDVRTTSSRREPVHAQHKVTADLAHYDDAVHIGLSTHTRVDGKHHHMARGEHPKRTPFCGGLLIIAAMLTGVAVTYWWHPPTAVRAVVLIISVVAALAGVVMTLRDYS
jgi:hypothetical protein